MDTIHVCLLLCSMVATVTPARILLLPFSFSSHVSEFFNIGNHLLERGHDVHMLVSPSLPNFDLFKKKPIPLITHHMKDPDIYSKPQEALDSLWEDLLHMTLLDDLRSSIDGFQELCSNPLSDDALFKKLEAMKFDLAIVDTIVCSRCLALIPYRLEIPFVNVMTTFEPWLLRNPSLPSVVPFNMFRGKSPDMTFWERLDNTYRQMEWMLFPRIPYLEDSYLSRYLGNKPPINIDELVGQALLWLIETDFVIDYPRPTMPNEVLIGGLTTQPGKPLPDDLEKFVNQFKDGVIVVSFGSMATNLPDEARAKLLQAFGKVKYGVIWRYPHSAPTDIPGNIKLLKWMPQQDLLAHSKTKLFITHSGANSQFEALYHAVPIISVPLFAEQHYNAKRALYHGFGITINILDFTADHMINSINKVIGDKSYHDNISKASGIFRSAQLAPQERATWWIEHVLNHGGAHLRAHALDIPWYQYLMLDIFLFVGAIMFLASLVLCKIARTCCGMMRGKKATKKRAKYD